MSENEEGMELFTFEDRGEFVPWVFMSQRHLGVVPR